MKLSILQHMTLSTLVINFASIVKIVAGAGEGENLQRRDIKADLGQWSA
jgi:hypothetical protein